MMATAAHESTAGPTESAAASDNAMQRKAREMQIEARLKQIALLQNEITGIKSDLNVLTPVGRLPREVLGQIFAVVRDDSRAAYDEADEFDDEDFDGGMSLASGMTGQSKMSALSTTSFADPGAVRGDLEGMMDGFLGDWDKANPGGGKKKGK